LIDFLSLRQYDSNVVGLKSAESGIEEIIRLSKDYKIIFCFDNDEAGKKTIEKLKGIKVSLFNPSEFIDGAKDVNDIMVTM
jgi:DNA primase